MALRYGDLDNRTRAMMVQELELDVSQNDVYVSPRLNAAGRSQWVVLLRAAAESHDDGWLAEQLRGRNLLNEEELQARGGKIYSKKVPHNAPETLAEGEFNRLYIRGVCARAVAEGIATVVVYRGRPSANPRPESEAMIGAALSAAELLEDLRRSKGRDPAMLPYVNSGLTVRLP